jgi:hypothetical protein
MVCGAGERAERRLGLYWLGFAALFLVVVLVWRFG